MGRRWHLSLLRTKKIIALMFGKKEGRTLFLFLLGIFPKLNKAQQAPSRSMTFRSPLPLTPRSCGLSSEALAKEESRKLLLSWMCAFAEMTKSDYTRRRVAAGRVAPTSIRTYVLELSLVMKRLKNDLCNKANLILPQQNLMTIQ